jgi:hypothetical protein
VAEPSGSLAVGSDVSAQRIARITEVSNTFPREQKNIGTASYTNKIHSKNSGAMSESEGLPSARMANVM